MIREVDEKFLVCRMLGHAWDPYVVTDWKPMFGIGLTMMCDRCYMIRHDTLNANGAVGQRSYVQPEGYRIPKEQAPTRAEVRQQFIREHVK